MDQIWRMTFFRKTKENLIASQNYQYLVNLYKYLNTWGAQGKMTQLNLMLNNLPRDFAEFSFFLIVGFTAGSIGLI